MFNDIPKKAGPEIELYKIFCKAIEDGKICPGYKLLPCDTKYDPDDPAKNKVDVGMYKMNGAPKDRRPNWIHQSMWIEFKRKGKEDDAFNDTAKKLFEVDSDRAAQVRGQLIAYAEMAMNRQHRTHLYSVFVMHKFARLIRWDRAGAVVSEKFDYKKNPEILGEFFWRFSHMTDEAQGYDPTAQLKKLPEPFDYIREAFAQSLEGKWPRYKLTVEDKEKGRRYLLVGEAHGRSLIWSVAEHVVLLQSTSRPRLEEQKVHEDTVEATEDDDEMDDDEMDGDETDGDETDEDVEEEDDEIDEDVEESEDDDYPLRPGELHLEGDILSHLNKSGVRNVPTLLYHGDVAAQVTVTRSIWQTMPERLRKGSSSMDSSGDRRHPPSTLVHYRLVEMEVGKPLSEFETSLELVKLISDCIIAHEDAVTNARVLHRDISSGNMLMYPLQVTSREGVTQYVWTGLLNDWELSKPIAPPGTPDVARRDGRTGTWQFMSSAILDDKARRPMIEDELESFFYVLVYYSVRYLGHNSTDVASFMLDFFDSYSFTNGEYSCGQGKRRALENAVLKWCDNQKIVFTGEGSRPHPLNDLIATMLPWFQGRYRMMEREQELRQPSTSGTDAQAKGQSETQTNKYAAFVTDEDIGEELGKSAKNRKKTAADEDAAAAAANLKGHRTMRLLLRQAVKTAIWPSDDKLGDQLPMNYTSKRTRGGNTGSYATTTGQKHRAEDILAYAWLRKRPRRA
ncbi:hypothetical protein A0H81_06315 [Grifola frondosa]|uniref:Fungal-type protein kinase domain-containing protein n=1 Tax=Grifola frondosa TaxID=5627 RepID=A0A1C7MBK1_GRIFR|nr:hypothetical protein A0H81_06315 [Grifola frondosa]